MEDKLEALKKQVAADFELTWTMMNDQGKRLDARVDEVKAALTNMGAEIQEGNRQLIGRMRLVEERFQAMLEAVTQEHQQIRRNMAELRAEVETLRDLPARVEALEKRPPAA